MRTPTALAAVALALACAASRAETYHLYFLGGQSNMEGYGRNAEIHPSDRAPVPNAHIFFGMRQQDLEPPQGLGVWAPVSAGFGVDFGTDGTTNTLGTRFGPELFFAKELRLMHPEENLAIIKYAKGGSSLDVRSAGEAGAWDPHDDRGEGEGRGRNQYDHALAVIEAATRVRDIDGDGEDDTLIPTGIVWMQGETDATHKPSAEAYAENLAEMVMLLRAALRDDALPVAVGRISDSNARTPPYDLVWEHLSIVQEAQDTVARNDRAVDVMTLTERYKYSDPYHYDTDGFRMLGTDFAEKMRELRFAP